MEKKEIVLITGGSGFVGSNAVDYCIGIGEGYEVLATDFTVPATKLLNNWLESSDFRFIKADLRNKRQLMKIATYLQERNKPVVVLHIGGVFDYLAPQKLLYDVNVKGTENLFEALRPLNTKIKRVVIWSGGTVYGNFEFTNLLPATEEYPINPQNAYGWSKLEEERTAFMLGKEYNIPVSIIRLGAVYGPRSKYGMAICIFLYANGQISPFLLGKGNNRVALTHAIDAVRAGLFLADKPEAIGEAYNVVDDCPHTMKAMAILLGEELKNPVYKRVSIPTFIFKMLVRNHLKIAEKLKIRPTIDAESAGMLEFDNCISNKKIKDLGFRFQYPDGKYGLKETIKWYKKEKLI